MNALTPRATGAVTTRVLTQLRRDKRRLEMENEILKRAAGNATTVMRGLVRVGATEGFGTLILAPHLARLTQRHPGLTIDLLALPRMVHLSRREADIVISLERPARGAVVVVKLTDYMLQLYGARSYLQQLVEAGAVLLHGLPVRKPAQRVHAGTAGGSWCVRARTCATTPS